MGAIASVSLASRSSHHSVVPRLSRTEDPCTYDRIGSLYPEAREVEFLCPTAIGTDEGGLKAAEPPWTSSGWLWSCVEERLAALFLHGENRMGDDIGVVFSGKLIQEHSPTASWSFISSLSKSS